MLLVILICLFTTSCSSTGSETQPYTGQPLAEWKAQVSPFTPVKLYYLKGNMQIWAVHAMTGYRTTYYTFVNNKLTEVDDGYGFTRSTPDITVQIK